MKASSVIYFFGLISLNLFIGRTSFIDGTFNKYLFVFTFTCVWWSIIVSIRENSEKNK